MLQRRVCIYISLCIIPQPTCQSVESYRVKNYLYLSLSVSLLFLSATFVHGRTAQREKKRKCWREPLQNRWNRLSQTNSQTASTAKKRSLQVAKERTVQLERTRSSSIKPPENLRLNISTSAGGKKKFGRKLAKINIISYSRFCLSGEESNFIALHRGSLDTQCIKIDWFGFHWAGSVFPQRKDSSTKC